MLLSLLSRRSLEVDSRDAYGFALRPQHIQRYREYANIYRDEEDERSDKWKLFLEQQSELLGLSSSEEEEQQEQHPVESAIKEEDSVTSPETVVEEGEDTGEKPSVEEEQKEQQPTVAFNQEPGSTSLSVGEGDNISKKPDTNSAAEGSLEKEVHSAKELKARKWREWADIRPVLGAIENTMSFRVKKFNKMENDQQNSKGDRIPSVEETGPSGGSSDNDNEQENTINDASNRIHKSSTEKVVSANEAPSEHFPPWEEELESLVRGGLPKDLRGELWQAFVGARTRRMEKYYQDLLSLEGLTGEVEAVDEPSVASKKYRKQIEKDIPRTFPGHPALDEHGRDSLRRLLIAYARHNPSVGYCQAMNFFAGLLLLVMPEENAFWTLVGIIDEYFEGYFTEEMIESQVDQLVFEELMRERFPKLVNHLDYLGVQVAWISGPWFLSIFINMIPWESVLRVWDVILFEGNRVMLFRTALALMELYGPALVTTKDAGDAITLLQTLTGSTFDTSQLVLTACMGFLAVTEARLQELRQKHRPAILGVIEERNRKGPVFKDSKGLASKLYSFKHGVEPTVEKKEESKDTPIADRSRANDLEMFLAGDNSEVDSVPDLQEQVVWLKVELCNLLEEKRSSVVRAEELETALMEMAQQDNRLQLSARVEQLEQEVSELQQALNDKKEQEAQMIQVLMRIEQEQKLTEDARISAENELAAQKLEVHKLQEKYEKALASIAQMEKRVVMAESMLEATLQYESGQTKALSSPRAIPSPTQSSSHETPPKRLSLLSRPFGFGWRNKGKPDEPESGTSSPLPKEPGEQLPEQ